MVQKSIVQADVQEFALKNIRKNDLLPHIHAIFLNVTILSLDAKKTVGSIHIHLVETLTTILAGPESVAGT